MLCQVWGCCCTMVWVMISGNRGVTKSSLLPLSSLYLTVDETRFFSHDCENHIFTNKPTLPNKKQPVTFPHPEKGHNKLILCKHLSTKFSSFEVRMPWELELGISPPQSLGPEGFVLGHYKQCAGMLTNIRNQCVNLSTMAECSLAMGTGPVLRPITLGKNVLISS